MNLSIFKISVCCKCLGIIMFCFLKYDPISLIFKMNKSKMYKKLMPFEEVFSSDNKILSFCVNLYVQLSLIWTETIN
jgi:hypothetical protein